MRSDSTTHIVTGQKTGFLSHLYIKMTNLPRQARDKHRENSKKVRFLAGKRHDHRKLLGFLSGMGVDADAAKLVTVVCCDWVTQVRKRHSRAIYI
jgi:hypothetical protein|eukprot:COSAG06_NODE_2992_length_5967_cov_4.409995_9_plen_95_part_00